MMGDDVGQVRWDIHSNIHVAALECGHADGIVGDGLEDEPLDPRGPAPVLLVPFELDSVVLYPSARV